METNEWNVLSPVESREGVFFKREDQQRVGEVVGGKGMEGGAIIASRIFAGKLVNGLTTAVDTSTTHMELIARLARHYKLPCRIHITAKMFGQPVLIAKELGAKLVIHKNKSLPSMIDASKGDVRKEGYFYIPGGMAEWVAIRRTREQTANIPDEVTRVIVPVQTGITLCGVLHGLRDSSRKNVLVEGVRLGGDPQAALEKFAPTGFEEHFTWRAPNNQYTDEKDAVLHGIQLDPVTTWKCRSHVQANTLLWLTELRSQVKRI